ncbi:fibronectin type III domain-containing protein [bacterium]|nr:fibronectin type III domain-containing protein [bacterium]
MKTDLRQATPWLLFALLFLVSCMGRGAEVDAISGASGGNGAGKDTPQADNPFPGLPALPQGDLDLSLPRITVAVDNIQTGNMALKRATSGAVEDGTDLVLTGSTEDYCWAVWRWGSFATNDFPQQLILDYSVGAGAPGTYLALSNYTQNRWEFIGPLDGSVTDYQYPGASTYISEGRNTYVAIIQNYSSSSTVVSLNLRSNRDVNPPAVPTGFSAEQVLPTQASLQWDDNSESDLEGYNLYQGNGPDFELTDPSTDKVNSSPILLSQYLVDELTAETDYYFRLTAQDSRDNESAPTAVLTVSTPFDSLPGAPTDLQVLDLGSKSALVSWTAPADEDLKGYQIFAETDSGFTVPPAVPNNPSLVPAGTTQYTITGLDPQTEYFWKVRAFDLGNQAGTLSVVSNFTTLDNAAPVADFEMTPDPAAVNSVTFFNPSPTTDEDNDLSELTFEWDFDNSGGAPDLETTGSQLAQWTYPARGVYTVKLTASDGLATHSITRDILVSYKVQYQLHTDGLGDAATVQAVDADTSGRIAVLYLLTGEFYVQYFDGDSWLNLPLTGLSTAGFTDVALGPGKVGVITASSQIVDPSPTPQAIWTVFEFNGSNWVSEATGSVNNRTGVYKGRLCYSQTTGRLSVALANHPQPGQQQPPDWDLDLWHERSDGTLANYKVYSVNTDKNWDLDLVRNDTTTRLIYAQVATTLREGQATDSAFTSAAIQTVAGTISDVRAELDPANDAQCYWYCQTSTPRIYFGDNFGTANGGSQFFAPARAPTAMLGLEFVGDNAASFYWTDVDPNGVDHYMHHITSTSTTTDIASEVGFASGGAGAPVGSGAGARVFNALTESRDGEIHVYNMDEETVDADSVLYGPSLATGVTTTHIPVLMGDGTVFCLSQETVPTALTHHLTSITQNSGPADFYGFDNSADLNAACRTANANEFFLASITTLQRLLLYRFDIGTTTGDLKLNTGPVQQVRLAHNPANDQVLVAYTNDNNRDIIVRSWNGTVWSAETTVYNGSLDLPAFELRPKASGEWGIAFFDSSSNLRLAETSGGVWQPAVLLGSNTLNAIGRLGFDYNADGSYALVVERSVDAGVFVGIDPLGQGSGAALSWELVESTNGGNAYSCKCWFVDASPVVGYHHSPGGINPSSRFRVYEKFGTWKRNELNFDIQGLPIGSCQDASGNILLLGFSLVNVPYRTVSISLSN